MFFKKKSYEELKKEYNEELKKNKVFLMKEKKLNELEKLKNNTAKLKRARFNRSIGGKLLTALATKTRAAKKQNQQPKAAKKNNSFFNDPLGNGLGMDPLGLNKPKNKKERKPWDLY